MYAVPSELRTAVLNALGVRDAFSPNDRVRARINGRGNAG